MSTPQRRYDRTLRVVMWLDAFLSFALAAVCMLASPIVAIAGLPHELVAAVGIAALTLCLLLAGFGAVTGGALIARMRAGQFGLPHDLRLPLPSGMRPPLKG